MAAFITSIYEIDQICENISNALDFPDGLYKKVLGINEFEGYMYFKIGLRTFAYIYLPAKQPRLTFSSEYINEISGLPYLRDGDELSISFGFDCDYWKVYWLMYRLMHEYSENISDYQFGCCSRYLECSNKLICLNPDKLMRYSCQYRQNKMNGRFFYGFNKNVK